MKKILFVDDEQKVLDGLRRLLFSFSNEWEMDFAAKGREALNMLALSRYDVIVADMRMPEMDGGTLLNEVARRYPDIVRIILSGTWEQDVGLKAAMVAHQYLSKPCDPEVLKATVNRAFALREVLMDHSLRVLLSRITSLPSTPAIYTEMMHELGTPETSTHRVGAILARDMGMTAKVLQLVNSAFFGLRRHITSPEDAVTFIGLDTIKALALSISAFSIFDVSSCPKFSIERLQEYSNRVASIAREIARSQTASKQELDDTFVAGLLHDIGKLVLVSSHPEKYAEVLRQVEIGERSDVEAERQAFGTSHAEVGGYLLSLWGLPDKVVEALAFHHNPSACPGKGFSPLTAVHAATCMDRLSPNAPEAELAIDRAYLSRLGLAGALPGWLSIARERALDSVEL